MDSSLLKTEHSEAAAILMDVSQQCESSVFNSQSQAATILMNVGHQSDLTVGQSEGPSILLDIDQHTVPVPSDAAAVLMDGGQETGLQPAFISSDNTSLHTIAPSDNTSLHTIAPSDNTSLHTIAPSDNTSLHTIAPSDMKIEAITDTYTLGEAATSTMTPNSRQQFQVMSTDGQYHTITLAGVESMEESGNVQMTVQIDTPGRETETVTVSGLTDGYNLESLAQIAEIVVNSSDRSANLVSIPEDNVTNQDINPVTVTEQYIAMKDNGEGKPICVQTEPDERNLVMVDQSQGPQNLVSVDQTQTSQNLVSVDQPQGSQNLVSLAQIAELVINQGCLETSDGLNPNIHQLQIGSDATNQPYVISGLDSNISSVQTVTSTPRKISQMRAPTRRTTTEYIAVPLKKPLPGPSQAGASNYTTTILPDSRNPPQKLPPERNIYSKIKAENGECYMVVLPDSDTLNPTQLRDLLTSYSASHTKSALGDRSEPAEMSIKVEPEKPMMYSAGSQTSSRKYSKLWPTAIKSSNTIVIEPTKPSSTRQSVDSEVAGGSKQNKEQLSSAETLATGTDAVVEIVKHGGSANDGLFDSTVKVKIEKPDEDADVAGEDLKDQEGKMDSVDNCGHEVAPAKRRLPSDPRPESRTVTVQTDVTSECYINVTPEELSINRKKPRLHPGRKRFYLDDPRPSKDSSDVMQTLVSPFLKRKKLLDLENAFYICGTCEAKFSTADELKTHSKEHKLKNVFCPACKRKCSNVKILADHVIAHTRCKTFKCSVCTTKTVFKSAEAFKTHVSEHLSVQNFRCGSCGQKFPHVANLRVHMRVHTGEKPFICDKCPMAFSQKAPLEAHVSSFHNKEKPFQCEECSVHFARKTDLKIHMRIHTGERPYACELCDKTFTSNSGLTSHKKTHFRTRYHKCGDCEKSFDTPTRLKRHVTLWHSGDRVLKCRICHKDVGNKMELRSHMQLHSSEPFPCVRCGYGTDKKDSLAKHIQENHPELVCKMPELFDSCVPSDQQVDAMDTKPKVIEITW
ncbi:uncharacterized protein LOC124125697 [Haliotis rufescens]|uniref:uncharacterized protein LOC124125697 n=1 Tax=Haliotis rufescens TaxID=6454 RepID=UPI00201F748D|nr:uncharacterized protein LOC124125697 [Haliotis rufescens]XP_048258037.1 uncharacterized protein LOC124125697 [Haliotis rufescens]